MLLQSFCSWPLNLGARDIDPPALRNPCVTYRQASIYMVPPFSSSSVFSVPHLHIEATTDHISLYSIYQWNKSMCKWTWAVQTCVVQRSNVQYYWLYPVCSTFHPLTHLLYNGKFIPLYLPHLFHLSPHTLPPGSHLFVLWICDSVSVCSFFFFLDSTDKWSHTVFVFFSLTYFTKA